MTVNVRGTSHALLNEFSENPHAMLVLWKGYAAILKANEIEY